MISKFRNMRRWLIILMVLGGVLAGCSRSAGQASQNGQTLLDDLCKTSQTVGGRNLASLSMMASIRQQSRAWLLDIIVDPEQVISSGDITTHNLARQYHQLVMPVLGLTQDEILAELGRILGRSAPPAQVPAGTPAANLPPGDAENGRALFVGLVHLKNGAPFCSGCHSINNTGILGGGTLGPNLTNAYAKYGEAELTAIIVKEPFLSMRPQFANNPITAQEAADLVAFIKSVAGQPEVNREPVVLVISVVGFLAILLAIAIYWRSRLRTVRRQLVENYRHRK